MNKKYIYLIIGIVQVLFLLLLYQWFKIYHTYVRDYGYRRMVQIGIKGGEQERALYYNQPNAVVQWVWEYWIKETFISLILIALIALMLRMLDQNTRSKLNNLFFTSFKSFLKIIVLFIIIYIILNILVLPLLFKLI